MMQGAWLYTVVEVISCVLVFLLCGCGPSQSGELGASPRITQPAGQGSVASSPPLMVPDWIMTALQSPDAQMRLRALDAWAQEGGTGLVDPVMLAFNDPDERVRTWALQLIEQDWLTELVALGIRDKTVSAQRNQSKC